MQRITPLYSHRRCLPAYRSSLLASGGALLTLSSLASPANAYEKKEARKLCTRQKQETSGITQYYEGEDF
jgi:hypothetical protein